MSGLSVTVDRGLSRRLADRLDGIGPRAAHFLPRPGQPEALGRLADLYLVAIGICQQTRTLKGVVRGASYRGSDYLLHKLCDVLDREPAWFEADHLAALRPEELAAALSDDGDPAQTTADRLEERTRQVRDIGRRLTEGYGGSAAGLIAASKGRLRGGTGLLARLARFDAYRDPVRKKSFLLVHFWRGLGLYEPVDPVALDLPVDYHILRVFLRAGVLRISGPRADALLAGGPMTAEEDVQLRRAAVRAGRIMSESVPLETLDLLLWMVGRNCCFYEHVPVCRTGPCTLGPTCSFLASTDLRCGAKCPLEGTCSGSIDPVFAAMHEPAIDTDFY